jgi:hypothetical protein
MRELIVGFVFFFLGGVAGYSLREAITKTAAATVADLKDWHGRLNDLLEADETRAKSIAAILKNQIRKKLSNAETGNRP